MVKHLIVPILAVLLIMGCTKTQEPPIHPSGWTESESEYSHVAKIIVTGIEECKACHGGPENDNYFGGTSGVSCYDCHAGGPSGHPAYEIWMGSPDDEQFHGNVVIEEGTDACQPCHGQYLDGGIAQFSCLICH